MDYAAFAGSVRSVTTSTYVTTATAPTSMISRTHSSDTILASLSGQ